jgi:hypothetical protein
MIKEEEEIRDLVYSSLNEHCPLGTEDVKVLVNEYNNL